MRRGLPLMFLALAACAYVLPASWRAFRIEADDAPPAITRALDAQDLNAANWDQAKDEITTEWNTLNDGLSQRRSRYVVRWERNEDDGTLTVYVRYEAQDRDAAVGGDWNGIYHDADKELALLDVITQEIQAQTEAP